ncbi:hypothetical protein BGZ95_005987 [Linnemannia exigua]|uniref:Cyanovirin-N domain-containing protein n=1 Tax=Linnemannia exigua TaxID=604196 RepID=A0AAD4DGA3_9FUNG|nr:hypothetical protein BGZ95_005987 [Linnemannia exigua]
MTSCQDCKEAWNPTSFDLDQVLGNNHGHFVWDQKRFSESAQDTILNSETAQLSATLGTGYYETADDANSEDPENDDTIALADRIQNKGGYLTFV